MERIAATKTDMGEENRISRWVEQVMAAGVILLMLTIVLQVICSALDINPLATFGAALPFLGKALSLNGLLDMQWHLLVIVGLVPAALVWAQDRHVRVDFCYDKRSPRVKARIDLAGNLIFAAPFFVMVLPAAMDFARRAWVSDEGSRNGGLMDLWLIKSVLPLGLGFLALAVALETLRRIGEAR